MSAPILVSGSIAYDYIMQYDGHFADHILPDQLDKLNVCYVVDQLHRYQWGTASNICYTLNLLWQSAILLGVVGYDYDLTYLQQQSYVDTQYVRQNPLLTTASFFGTSDQRANQLMFFSPGAMSDSSALAIVSDPDIKYIMIAPDDPHTMILRLEQYHNHPAKIIRDPWQQITNLTTAQLQTACQQADILIVNEYEYMLYQSKTWYDGTQLNDYFDVVIVTQGAQGSTRYTATTQTHISAIPYDGDVYPTGWGDAYRAGLLHGLIVHNEDRDQAMQIATRMWWHAIQHHGWQQHTLTQQIS